MTDISHVVRKENTVFKGNPLTELRPYSIAREYQPSSEVDDELPSHPGRWRPSVFKRSYDSVFHGYL